MRYSPPPCPECGAWAIVNQTRRNTYHIKRVMECANGHTFTHNEMTGEPPVKEVKTKEFKAKTLLAYKRPPQLETRKSA